MGSCAAQLLTEAQAAKDRPVEYSNRSRQSKAKSGR
jgi:hypothetical protein